MRIAMVSEHASPLAALGGADAGGQNVHVGALATELGRRGHRVTVYTRRDDPGLDREVPYAPGVAIRHVDAGPPERLPKDELLPYMAGFGAELAKDWAADPPDVAHAHFWMSGVAVREGARELGIPMVQTFHALGTVKRRFQGDGDTSPPERIGLERAVGEDFAAIIATCRDEARELRSMGIPRRRTSVVPCGVDLSRFTPDGPVARRGERPRILSIGRLVPRKGVDTLVRALAAVPEAELLVAGGPPKDELDGDPEVARLRRCAEAAGTAGRVRFLGQVPRPQVPKLMRSADVVVSVPWYEPFGMVPLEAMACGVPVVASRVGGHVDTVIDGLTGTLVPPCRADELARALRTLLSDPCRLESLGIAAADRAAARFSWERVAAQTEEAYQRAVEWRAEGPPPSGGVEEAEEAEERDAEAPPHRGGRRAALRGA
ncbi:glycosyltransferase [Allonocardiopsis opalescens]|uniref:Glycosyltransferase involved in cell wall biosynthesis n=1 Tax=Allonocardiopsis opalescens TaxID=1144618 RepID=A0A2T0PXB4_9ACTN|nr:glycosyltransferase [Allonocardiopsis opalescens]PRX96175.1 glycosyltransferase involved in cell wall biosynthesis [Allonocardiopsis opalescens]